MTMYRLYCTSQPVALARPGGGVMPRYQIVCRVRGIADYPSVINGDTSHTWPEIVGLWHLYKLAAESGFYVVVPV